MKNVRRRSRLNIMSAASMRLAVFLFAISIANAAASDQIVGRWRTLKTSQGGIGEVYKFLPNGDVVYSPGAIVETTYRVEGDQLWIHGSNAGESEEKLKIKWLGENKLRLEPPSGSTRREDKVSDLTRRGERGNSKDPIIGEWTGTRDMGGRTLDMLWCFYPDGKSLFLMPFTHQPGHYTVKESTIRIELPEKTIERQFEINGDVLTLTDASGTGESRLKRF